jgi:predicted lysophospholipase L1 biosynthesis ABC-type transport system permease subunit
VFGGIALFLAAIGVYGVLSYSMSSGCGRSACVWRSGRGRRRWSAWSLRQGLLLALIGILVGLPLAFGASRVVAGSLYNVDPNDPLSFGVVALVLVAIAGLASYMPARRALDVDPLESLRGE